MLLKSIYSKSDSTAVNLFSSDFPIYSKSTVFDSLGYYKILIFSYFYWFCCITCFLLSYNIIELKSFNWFIKPLLGLASGYFSETIFKADELSIPSLLIKYPVTIAADLETPLKLNRKFVTNVQEYSILHLMICQWIVLLAQEEVLGFMMKSLYYIRVTFKIKLQTTYFLISIRYW